MEQFIYMALIATMGTWAVTALGAATVVFFRKPSPAFLNLMLGFSAGVMIAASFWSLLQPAIETAQQTLKTPAYIVVTIGFLSGAVFMWLSDKTVSKMRRRVDSMQEAPDERSNRIIMLILSITLHNIPEGLAVGVAFGILKDGYSAEGLMGAVTVAVGIGLQNFPEGAAVSIPLRREGYSRRRCFFLGQASGIVEPVSGVVGAVLVTHIATVLPCALAFAAGAMILVAVHELIPECQENKQARPYYATMGIVVGFAVMMLLDVMFEI